MTHEPDGADDGSSREVACITLEVRYIDVALVRRGDERLLFELRPDKPAHEKNGVVLRIETGGD